MVFIFFQWNVQCSMVSVIECLGSKKLTPTRLIAFNRLYYDYYYCQPDLIYQMHLDHELSEMKQESQSNGDTHTQCFNE